MVEEETTHNDSKCRRASDFAFVGNSTHIHGDTSDISSKFHRGAYFNHHKTNRRHRTLTPLRSWNMK